MNERQLRELVNEVDNASNIVKRVNAALRTQADGEASHVVAHLGGALRRLEWARESLVILVSEAGSGANAPEAR